MVLNDQIQGQSNLEELVRLLVEKQQNM